MKKQRLIIVYDGRGHDRLLRRLGFFPNKNKAGQYLGFFSLNARPLVLKTIDQLKAAGLHGIHRKVPDNARQPPKRQPNRQPKQPRPKQQPLPLPTAQIIQIDTEKELRLAKEALKRAREERRQAEQRAHREIYQRAESAVKRAKGEEP